MWISRLDQNQIENIEIYKKTAIVELFYDSKTGGFN